MGQLCAPCPTNQYPNPERTSCVPISQFRQSDFRQIRTVDSNGTCVDGRLGAGTYRVVLRGGNGGQGSNGEGGRLGMANLIYGGGSGGTGAQLTYVFTILTDTEYRLCRGSNGGSGSLGDKVGGAACTKGSIGNGGGGGRASRLRLARTTFPNDIIAGAGGGGGGGPGRGACGFGCLNHCWTSGRVGSAGITIITNLDTRDFNTSLFNGGGGAGGREFSNAANGGNGTASIPNNVNDPQACTGPCATLYQLGW